MRFRLRCEWLETRENPSGPAPLDPIGPVTGPNPPPNPPPSDPAPVDPIIVPGTGVPYNPWGG
jgi:hypothetical protein